MRNFESRGKHREEREGEGAKDLVEVQKV